MIKSSNNQTTSPESFPLLAMKMLGGGVLAALLSLILSVLVSFLITLIPGVKIPETGKFLVGVLALVEEAVKLGILSLLFLVDYGRMKFLGAALGFSLGFFLVELWLVLASVQTMGLSAYQFLVKNPALLMPLLIHFLSSFLLLVGISWWRRERFIPALFFWLLATVGHLCYNLYKI